MGRCVSCPKCWELRIFKHVNIDDENAYNYLIDDIVYTLQTKYKSLIDISCDNRWLDSEDKIILENDLVQIGISIYFNVACIWVIKKEQYSNLADNFIATIKEQFLKLGDLKRTGIMSNGVAVYEKV
jgi:hypothetical protein